MGKAARSAFRGAAAFAVAVGALQTLACGAPAPAVLGGCGDGICAIFAGEDSENCPLDCDCPTFPCLIPEPDATPIPGDGAPPDGAPPDAPPGCGDGTQQPGEECDDGNLDAIDGCSPSCTVESFTCGDGAQGPLEGCDDGNTTAGDGCDDSCQVELGECGDGALGPTEQCDDGNVVGGDGCDAACQDEIDVCGDGAIGWSEECDDGNTTSGDGCDDACRNETVPCGDGTCAGGETCTSCPVDCGDCSDCDGVCTIFPDCSDCPADCSLGECGGGCGDGICGSTETCSSCASDCGDCAMCNGVCAVFPDCITCRADCTASECGAICTDGHCGAGENCTNCSADCGACDPCDGVCSIFPDCVTCPGDCSPAECSGSCGDTTCDPAFDCHFCPDECAPDDCKCDGFCNPSDDCGIGPLVCPTDCPAGTCVGGCGDGVCDAAAGETCQYCAEDCHCPVCSDFVDNDGDALVDWPDDPGCAAACTRSESDLEGLAIVADFGAGTPGMTLVGQAYFDGTAGDVVLMVPNAGNAAGAAWLDAPIHWEDVHVEFDMWIGGGTGADGLALVMQRNGSTALGRTGNGLGYCTLQGWAVEFDTYDNDEGGPQSIGIVRADDPLCQTSGALARNTVVPCLGCGVWQHVSVNLGAGSVIDVQVDGVTYLADVALPGWSPGKYTLGFTAARGSSDNYHIIDNVTVTVTVSPDLCAPYCGDDLCEGDETCSTCPYDCPPC